MNVIDDVRTFDGRYPNLALTIGSFDGVHLGHRRILETLCAEARAADGAAAVMTMRPHPRRHFSPERAPNLLTSDAQKFRLFAQASVDAAFVLPFDATVAAMEPEAFLEEIVVQRCGATRLVVGHDFRFGKGARGDYDFLCAAAPAYGLRVQQIEPLLVDGERVSSTVIRECILEGDLTGAERYLGRKYAIEGAVRTGRGIGRKLGYPTANLHPGDYVIPAHGVYAARAYLGGESYVAAVNIGIAPTIRHEDTVIEAFLLDFSRNIEGQSIELEFHVHLRPERKFATTDALIDQIAKDVEDVRALMR